MCTWFLEVAFVWEVGMCVCLCGCVCVDPQAIRSIHVNVIVINQTSSTAFQFLYMILAVMGVALVTKYVMNSWQGNTVFAICFTVKCTNCILLTRQIQFKSGRAKW